MIRQSFGRYQLLEQIGRGGMAEVFRATMHTEDGGSKLVAVKRVPPAMTGDPKVTAMFVDEAKIAARLSHPNIAAICDVGSVENQYYIAMEHIHGRDLRAIFRRYYLRGQAVPLSYACYIAKQLCDGLTHAHGRRDELGRELGVVHRDVSPSNALVSFDGEVKIIDFGIAKAIGRITTTETGVVKGKTPYMSPEQVQDDYVDHRSDIFACGTVLFELFTGARLFTGDNPIAIMDKVADAVVPRPSEIRPDLPKELDEILLKALHRFPEFRYQRASDLGDALMALAKRRSCWVSQEQVAGWLRELFADEYAHEAARIRRCCAGDDALARQPTERPDLAEGSLPGWELASSTFVDSRAATLDDGEPVESSSLQPIAASLEPAEPEQPASAPEEKRSFVLPLQPGTQESGLFPKRAPQDGIRSSIPRARRYATLYDPTDYTSSQGSSSLSGGRWRNWTTLCAISIGALATGGAMVALM